MVAPVSIKNIKIKASSLWNYLMSPCKMTLHWDQLFMKFAMFSEGHSPIAMNFIF